MEDKQPMPTTIRQRFTLDELLAQCDQNAPATVEREVWEIGVPVGEEVW